MTEPVQRIAEGTWTKNDLIDLSPFRWAGGEVTKVDKTSKKGKAYTMNRVLIRPKNAAEGVVFAVEVFEEMQRHIRIMSAMNPDGWLVATPLPPKVEGGYGDVAVSIQA